MRQGLTILFKSADAAYNGAPILFAQINDSCSINRSVDSEVSLEGGRLRVKPLIC